MAVTFIKTSSKSKAETIMVGKLRAALKSNKRVLWIVTGGSNISVIVNVMNKLTEPQTAKLAVLLSDERFGEPGHADSNLQQLYDAGLKSKQATVLPILQPGATVEQITDLYAQMAKTAFEAADASIALLGMGSDGHIAGLLPGSPAITDQQVYATSYEAADFTRLTLTPFALSHMDEVVLMANGEAKRGQLEALRDKNLTIFQQPAQILKKLPELTVVSDQIGGTE